MQGSFLQIHWTERRLDPWNDVIVQELGVERVWACGWGWEVEDSGRELLDEGGGSVHGWVLA
jgi:hypothetical protein